jgi:hypothetical protein
MVKIIAPHIYESQSISENLIMRTPRPMIYVAKAYFKSTNLVGVEIGTKFGDNALSILKMLPMKRLYLVDPYYTSYKEDGKIVDIPQDAFNIAKGKICKFPQAKFIIKTSDEACKVIHEKLDFVYIDGNHTYEYVKRDITNYYPLIKLGGLIGGHDYTKGFNGVIKASNEFAKENNLELNTIYPDWWIFKHN